MKRFKWLLFAGLTGVIPRLSAQTVEAIWTTEWQYDFHRQVNWVNLLRLDATVEPWRGGSFELATLHIAQTGSHIVPDLQGFSNIEAENCAAALAKLGYRHQWEGVGLFLGIRNVNEDFFTSPCTSLFTGSSCGIFPTVSASYPIANYPMSGLCLHADASFGAWKIVASLYDGVGSSGWNRSDNPFLLDFRHDGVFGMAEVSRQGERSRYFAGAALHNRFFPVGSGGEQLPPDEALHRVSCAWYLYAEQALWRCDAKRIDLMIQYSENTEKHSGCSRYAEIGCTWRNREKFRMGISTQYADFVQSEEWSVEATVRYAPNTIFSLQPAFQLIRNATGCFPVFSIRLCCNFELF